MGPLSNKTVFKKAGQQGVFSFDESETLSPPEKLDYEKSTVLVA